MTSYPVHLGIAYILLVGYLARTLFVSLRLPASVGVLISGFLFAHFLQDDLQNAHSSLQEIAFFCVLFEAGLDLTLRDLQPYVFVLAWLPWALEVLAVASYGMMVLGFTRREGLALGTILSALGPGLVMPKMKEFGARFKGHPMPRLVFTWAPLEGSMTLAIWGFLLGLVTSQDTYASSENIGMLILANGLRIIATVGVAAFIGSLSAWLISRRMQLRVSGRALFTGVSVETFLMALAAALLAFGLGAETSGGHVFVPLGFAPGSLFISELLVVAMGSTFAMSADRVVLQEVKGIMGGLWVFGQLILFSMIGSGTSLTIIPEVKGVLPLIGVGLAARLVGIFVAVFSTASYRGCKSQSTWSTVQDALFCFLSALPRATMQGALGNVPMTARFFRGSPNGKAAEKFIYTAARVYILCMSVVGQTSLNTVGPLLLHRTMERPAEEHGEGIGTSQAGTLAEAGASNSTISTGAASEYERLGAIGLLAEEHAVDPKLLQLLLEEAQEEYGNVETEVPPVPHPGEDGDNAGKGYAPLESLESRPPRRASLRSADLVLNQFDVTGSLGTSGGSASSPALRRAATCFA